MSIKKASARPTLRMAAASAAVATLAIVAACTDGGAASSLNGPSARFGQSVGPTIANAASATVCVTGPQGIYTFVSSNLTVGANGTTATNVPLGTQYSLTVDAQNQSPCVDVLTRTSADLADAVSGITVMLVSSPAGAVYQQTNCVDDPGAQPSSPCGNPTRLYANRFHGSKATFVFNGSPVVVVGGSPVACTVTRGFIFNQLDLITNSTGPQISVTINGTKLTKQQIYDALNAPTKGDLRVQLKAQLITALANISIGAQSNGAVNMAITNAQTYLLPGNTASNSLVSAAIDTLTTFNEGNAASPASPHCTDAQEAILKDQA